MKGVGEERGKGGGGRKRGDRKLKKEREILGKWRKVEGEGIEKEGPKRDIVGSRKM